MAVSLTQNNMIGEINRFNKKVGNLQKVDLLQKAPAKLDPNNSMRRLSITQQNLGSYNSLFALGNIRRDHQERTINFTAGQNQGGKMGDFASSTITDLRQIMMRNDLENLAVQSFKGAELTENSSLGVKLGVKRFNMNNTISGGSY